MNIINKYQHENWIIDLPNFIMRSFYKITSNDTNYNWKISYEYILSIDEKILLKELPTSPGIVPSKVYIVNDSITTSINDSDLKNLNIMIPFWNTLDEARKVTEIIHEQGLVRSNNFKVYIKFLLILSDQFNQFVNGYSISSNNHAYS